MPYSEEHSCRLRSPDDMQAGSFRRVNGDRDHDGKKYDVIYARPKGEDTMVDQAFRYPKGTWTSAAARSHCASHDGSFEAAAAKIDESTDRPLSFQKPHVAGTRRWFKVEAGDSPEVFIYDEIGRGFFGGGVAAEDFIQEIKALKLKSSDELTVRINSPGGDLFDGNTIYNYLRSVKAKITMRIDGIAASAASIIAMAGDRIEMPENAFLFIHNPWMMAIGDANTMRKVASDLDTMRDGAVATYQRRVGDRMSRDEIVQMLDAETWLTAEQAVAHGFADVVDEPVRAAALARFDLGRYGYPVPVPILKARDDEIAECHEILDRLRDAGGTSTAGANAIRNDRQTLSTNQGVMT